MKEHAVTLVTYRHQHATYMQHTILRKGCMLGELGGGGGGSGRKIKRETEGERRGGRERLRKREEHAVTYVQCAVNILS